MNNFKISIVIPCFNEEDNIPILLKEINLHLTGYNTELIFIDDNSTDNSLLVLEELAKKFNNLYYLSFSRNFGHQSALKAGLDYSSGDCVITMDADLQHPPDMLPALIESWINGYEIVFTVRKNSGKISTFKKNTATYFYRILNRISDIKIVNGAADFRLLDKKVVQILRDDIKEYHLFYRGLISWMGFKQIGIDYVASERYSGQSKYSIKKMISFGIEGITSFSTKPLRIAIILGFILSVLSALYGLYAFIMFLFVSETVRGWTSVLLSILFIGGVNMILLGIIGEYVGKIFIQTKNRPHYLIKKSNLAIE